MQRRGFKTTYEIKGKEKMLTIAKMSLKLKEDDIEKGVRKPKTKVKMKIKSKYSGLTVGKLERNWKKEDWGRLLNMGKKGKQKLYWFKMMLKKFTFQRSIIMIGMEM